MKFIEGYPGNYVAIARKSGQRWYIAGINGNTTDKTLSIDLAAFKKSKATVFNDGTNGQLFSNTVLNTSRQGKINITMKANGGFVIVLE
ncbi:MAG TPA: glycoside hydrolase family 97 C-terminal domain-containing protein [Phnomibacter sp.]|nr:glycoside hydrolase family 97 C-terminal domain-containing protein [Phnomibacter sp.]